MPDFLKYFFFVFVKICLTFKLNTFFLLKKGTSADQDSRFSDKNKKLMKTMKFADNLEKKVKS